MSKVQGRKTSIESSLGNLAKDGILGEEEAWGAPKKKQVDVSKLAKERC